MTYKNNKRYYTLNQFYQDYFGTKISKISLNAGFTCPNRDGSKGVGGCIFCSASGSGDYAGNKAKSLTQQFYDIKEIMDHKWPNAKYIAYFQANTNTYAKIDVLKQKYEEVLIIKDVVGVNIATRCDAIDDDCLNYLDELKNKCYLTIELGLQTINPKTSEFINRGHTLEEFTNMVHKLREKKINVVVHIINGLPYETKEDMLNTIKFINTLDIQGVKIHMLHILKGTKLAEIYKEKPFKVLSKEEYINIVCDQLELLNPNIVINRITGDPKIDDLIEPNWLVKKFCVLNDIDKEMKRRNTYQGQKYKKEVITN